MKEEYKENTDFMLGKGIYCYEYCDSMAKFDQTEKPKKADFYSSLYDSHITDEEYTRFCDVWDKMMIQNLGEYHDLYLMTDVLQLADVFESFRKVCLTYYQLDPCQYYTSPGLAWDAMLKMTGVKLQALDDVDMYLFCEMGKRGGVSTITKRYAQANNQYMGKDYDKSKPNNYLMDWDANNLYGWAMSQFLPVDGFQWCANLNIFTEQFIKSLRDDMETGFFLQVDLEYPEALHDLHNDYPLCPETMEVKEISPWSQGLADKLDLHSAKVQKLVPNLNDKNGYVIHYRALKQCLELGLKLKKVHKVLQFNQSPWLAKYVDFNTEKRKVAKNDFEKDFFKLMNNSVYGKTNENIRNRINFRLINDEKAFLKCVNKPTFKDHVIFNEHLVGVHQLKTQIMLNKPVYVGVAILDLSKVLMYDFHYGVIKKEFGNKATLLGTDTDSLKYSIECDDLYQWMNERKHYFDLSDYPKDHFCYDEKNKKVIGKMKDEMNSEIMTEFIGLRAKMYAQKTNSTDKKKQLKKIAKGIKRSVIKKDVSFEDYKQALFAGANIYKKMKTFRSYNHVLYTIEMNKSGLCAFDDKRWVLDNGIDTLAHGHYKIKNLK